MALSPSSLWKLIETVRLQTPIVHNITNFVVMQTTANALLAFGASPIMAHEEEEMDNIVGISSALVVNIGTLSKPWIKSMKKAVQIAKTRNIPIIIDPVGAGASPLRTTTAIELAELAGTPLIRGNASEIMALSGGSGASRGVDSAVDTGTDQINQAKDAATDVAKKFSATVCISGKVDIVTDGNTTYVLHGGSELMPKVTGTGCTASALIGAVAGANPDTPLVATCAAMAAMSTAGFMAEKHASAPGSFMPAFLDALYLMQQKDMEKNIQIAS